MSSTSTRTTGSRCTGQEKAAGSASCGFIEHQIYSPGLFRWLYMLHLIMVTLPACHHLKRAITSHQMEF